MTDKANDKTAVVDEVPATVTRRAKSLLREMLAACEGARRSPLTVGWLGALFKEEGLFAVLGFDSEAAFRKHVGVGRSTWFRYVRLAEGLKKLSKEEFLKLRAENADHLIKLPEDRRYRGDLIKKAQELTEEEFEKVVVAFTAKEDKIDEGEVVVTLKWRMPESRRAVILDAIKWFANQNDLDVEDQSRSLELMCAELRHRNPVVTRLMKVTTQLREAHELLTGSSNTLSAGETMAKVDGVIGQVIRGMAEAAGMTIQ